MVILSRREWKRLRAIRKVESGTWTMAEAAQGTGLSVRQLQRVRRRVRDGGEDAIAHGNRGRSPPNRCGEVERKRVERLYRTKYGGFNDSYFTEKLQEEGLGLSRSTVRRILRAAGVAAARKRRPPKHRARRDRKPQAGLMILWDGSRHDWLEGRGPMLCLVGAIDDATSEFLPGAHFVDQECTAAYLRVLEAIVREKGVPWSSYGDRHGIFRRNDDHWTLEEELRGEQDPTQLGRALAELGIERIDALSPQAKGRVERLWGTLQDRLCSELRLVGARTAEQANRVLEAYRPKHNRRFAVAPADMQPAWRARPLVAELQRALSFRYHATVLNDNTVRLSGLVLDVPPGPGGRSYAHARVEVHQQLDGSWRVWHQGRCIATAPSTELGELRARKNRKRSAASRAFRAAVERVATALP
jgi:transposase